MTGKSGGRPQGSGLGYCPEPVLPTAAAFPVTWNMRQWDPAVHGNKRGEQVSPGDQDCGRLSRAVRTPGKGMRVCGLWQGSREPVPPGRSCLGPEPCIALARSFIQQMSPEGLPWQSAVQGLRLRLPMQGMWVRSLVGELRSHVPRGQKTKT